MVDAGGAKNEKSFKKSLSMFTWSRVAAKRDASEFSRRGIVPQPEAKTPEARLARDLATMGRFAWLWCMPWTAGQAALLYQNRNAPGLRFESPPAGSRYYLLSWARGVVS